MNMNEVVERQMTYNELGWLLNNGRHNIVWTDKANANVTEGRYAPCNSALLRRHLSYTIECRDKEVSNIIISLDGGNTWTLPYKRIYDELND